MNFHNTENGSIYHGDSREILKGMPTRSVHCCVTSPPYWALRNYGTATWEGGDPNCQHGDHDAKYIGDRCQCGATIVDRQIGIEDTIDLYVQNLCDIFTEVGRVLRDDGTLWVNIADTYSGSGNGTNDYSTEKSKQLSGKRMQYNRIYQYHQKQNPIPKKSLCLIPERFAIEMVKRGWILRNEIIWKKTNAMPASVKDRFTVDHEKVYFFTKRGCYRFRQILEDAKASSIARMKRAVSGLRYSGISDAQTLNRARTSDETREVSTTRNKRTVWSIPTSGTRIKHFASYPQALIAPMIEAGCPPGGIVLDPFFGTGTTAIEAIRQGKKYIGIDLSISYCEEATKRITALSPTQQTIALEERS